MTQTLLEFANARLEAAKALRLKTSKELMPLLVADGDEPIIIGVPDYGNPAAKFILRAQLSAMLKKHNAERYCFIMEAWVGSFGFSDERAKDPGYFPSKDPERTEAIVITAVEKGGQQIVMAVEIKRAGSKVTFGETKRMDGALGTLSELFGTGLAH